DRIQADYLTRGVPQLTRLSEQPGRLTSQVLGLGPGRALVELNARMARARERAIVRRAQSGYDAIYLQKVGSWPLVQALRASCRARLVYDLNDAVWLPSRATFADGRVRDILQS